MIPNIVFGSYSIICSFNVFVFDVRVYMYFLLDLPWIFLLVGMYYFLRGGKR